MENENFGFCPACGANLPSDSSFCPECGHNLSAPVSSGPAQPGAGVGYGYSKSRMSTKLKVAAIFVTIYAVIEILGALSMLTISMAMIDTLDEMLVDSGQGTFEEMLKDLGYNMTSQEFVDMCHILGIIELISGVLAGVGAFFCFKLKKRMIAVGLVVAASLILFAGVMYPNNIVNTVFSVIIGLLMAYLIYSSPDQFED